MRRKVATRVWKECSGSANVAELFDKLFRVQFANDFIIINFFYIGYGIINNTDTS